MVISFIGMENKEVPIKPSVKVTLKPMTELLSEVLVPGTYGSAKKLGSMVGSVAAVKSEKIANRPSANFADALQGQVAGLQVFTSSGEPSEGVSMRLRGIGSINSSSEPLFILDGAPISSGAFSAINPNDIENLTILKDASSTSIYGSRAANGVIVITTKRGKEGKVNIDVKVEGGYNTRTRTPEFVDGYTYASLLNEARITRNLEPRYTPTEMGILRQGLDPDLYPNVDWKDALLRDGAWSERATINVSGGGSTARYYVSIGYLNQEGMYNTDNSLKEDYNTNANLSRWTYRMNADLNVTPTTLVSVGIGGSLDLQNMPGMNNDQIWESIVGQNPISIPFLYSDGKIPTYGMDNRINPWVMSTQTGYQENWLNKIQTNITLEQKLDFITKGLKFVGRYGFDTENKNKNNRTKRPELWQAENRRDENGKLVMKRVGEEQLMTQYSEADGYRNENLEAELHYNRLFAKKHDVGATLKYFQYQKVKTANVGDDIMKAIARRSMGVSGRITYAYDYRYFAEFNFGYTGSENFMSGHQFGFFPAISAGWNIAEEKFIKNRFKWLEMLKIRYSYGEVGNDRLDKDEWVNRFPYLYTFGSTNGWDYGDNNNSYPFPGYHYSQISSPNLGWEIAKKHNLGLDLSIYSGKFTATVDIYQDTREQIYMKRQYLPQIVGVTSQPWANVGKMRSKGIDGNFMFHEKIGQVDFTVRGNMTYTKNEVLEYDEQMNSYPYQMTEGFRFEQARGLIALGLFKDYDDIRNSPKQEFGDYMPGDIKYKDVNGDGVINNLDMAPIGASDKPSLIYGLGFSANWKGLDFNIHFQGAGKSSYFINGSSIYAFKDGEWGNILTDMAKSGNRWISSEISGTSETENPNAKYPRLSYGGNNNNYRNSSYWLRDGSYLRLKTLEIGYSLPQKWVNKMRMTKARFYILGNNLAVWDSLKLWDPELASGDGMKYPLSKTYTLGLNVTF